MFLNEGMRAGIPNPKTRERTITLYVDKAAPAKSTSASIMIGGSASSFVSTDFPHSMCLLYVPLALPAQSLLKILNPQVCF